MVCIYCSSPTEVTNSRLQRRNNHVWRRRACSACGNTFTTIERPELSGLIMVDVSGNGRKLTPFHRDQLFITIYESCKHRPDAIGAAGSLTQTVINMLLTEQQNGVVKRSQIVERTHQVLSRFDPTAATVYAAYHPTTGES